jgi:hypothetical protein
MCILSDHVRFAARLPLSLREHVMSSLRWDCGSFTADAVSGYRIGIWSTYPCSTGTISSLTFQFLITVAGYNYSHDML